MKAAFLNTGAGDPVLIALTEELEWQVFYLDKVVIEYRGCMLADKSKAIVDWKERHG